MNKIKSTVAAVVFGLMLSNNLSYAGINEDIARAEIARLTAICNSAKEAAAAGLNARGLIEVLYKAYNLSDSEKSLYVTCYDKQIDSMLGRGK